MEILGKEIKLVVFDMAGTTVDEKNVVYKTVTKAINEYGVDVNLDTVLEHGAGKEKHQAIKDVLKSQDIVDGDLDTKMFSFFKENLDAEYETLDVAPITGVDTVMENLKSNGVKVVLNTGYSTKIAELLLAKLNWKKGEQYDMLLTADSTERGRPYPDMINLAMKEFEITDSAQVLKAGDSGIDIEEGKNAGCGLSVGVLSGAQNKEQLEVAAPDAILASLKELV